MIIDATDLIVGKLATFVAKKALLGEKIDIINAEKAIITGKKEVVLARFKQKRDMGVPLQGPYYPRQPQMMLKRSIRGMLPYKQEKGESALNRIRCHIGVPVKLASEKVSDVKIANASTVTCKYVSLGEISKELGAKI